MAIVIRNPFVTKKDKYVGANLLEMARTLAEAAVIAEEKGDMEASAKLIVQSAEMWTRAAKRFGFRNIKDLHTYMEKHGKL